MTKTILHVAETTGPGGAETVFVQLATQAPRNGFRNLAALPGPGWVADKLVSGGQTPLRIPIVLRRRLIDLDLYRALVRLIREHNVDLVHSHSFGISGYSCLAGLRTGARVVCTLHGEVDLGHVVQRRGIKLRILRYGASKIVLVSNRLRERLLAESNIPARITSVIYNGVDCDRHSEGRDRTLRLELGITAAEFLFGAIGNIREPKAYDNLLRAAAIAVRADPRLRFVIVGEGSGPLLDELIRLRATLGLEETVHFAGFRQDVTVPLRNFDAFVMSSRSEGFPVSVVQAMAQGLPIVATRCGGPEEQLTDGADGLLVPREDPAALAAAMLRIGADEPLRIALGAAARRNARSKFSLSAMLDAYDDLYRDALGL